VKRRARSPGLLFAAVLAIGSERLALGQDMAFALKAGTTGIGGDLTIGLSEKVNLRGGGAWFGANGTWTQQKITYEGTAKLQNGFAVLDLHPGGGIFRVSVGAVYNNNRVTGQSTGSTLIVNGIPYSAQDVGTLTAAVHANPVCPYLGIGIGNAIGRGAELKLVLDVGVYYIGSPKVSLTASPPTSGPLPPGFAEDLEQERRKIEDDLSRYRYFPVVSLGISVQL
jgi:hypothetical protein